MKNYHVLLCALVSFALSCQTPPPTPTPHAFFLKSYKNYAWGYSHYGWIMDEKGQLHSFANPYHWNEANEQGFISKDALLDNIESAYLTSVQCSQRELNRYNEMAQNTFPVRMSDTTTVSFDGGQTNYYCFVFDPTKNMYARVFLRSDGDWYHENTNRYALELSEWMDKVNVELHKSRN